MKAKKYEIKVCASALDYAHGGGYVIEEVYIPELDVCFNYQCIFVPQKGRIPKKFEEIELPSRVCKCLAAAAKHHNKLKKDFGWDK